MFTNCIPFLLSLSNSQTGEEDPDTVKKLYSPPPVFTDNKDFQIMFSNCIPFLLSLSNSQTGEEDPDSVKHLYSPPPVFTNN